jgi:hypothetical protein
MNDQNLKAAEQLFERVEPAPIIGGYEAEQLAIKTNFERLKAERLAREAMLGLPRA